jgi:pilus assembly protein Flp/PilA
MVGKLRRCRRGATAIEYGLILALVVLAMMAALRGLAGTTVNMWSNVDSAVAAAH